VSVTSGYFLTFLITIVWICDPDAKFSTSDNNTITESWQLYMYQKTDEETDGEQCLMTPTGWINKNDIMSIEQMSNDQYLDDSHS